MTWRQGNVQSIGVDELSGEPRSISVSEHHWDNVSGILPTEFKCLVEPEKVEERTKGGIIKLAETVERDQYAAMIGRLIAVSPLAFTYENWPDGARKPRVGDRIIFAKYAGAKVEGKDGNDYRIIADKDVMALFE